MGRLSLEGGDGSLRAVEGAEHAFHLDVVEAVVEVLGEVDAGGDGVAGHEVVEARLVKGPVDGGDHASEEGVALPVLLQAEDGVVGQGLDDFLGFFPVACDLRRRPGGEAFHEADGQSVPVGPGELQGGDDGDVVLPAGEAAGVVDVLWRVAGGGSDAAGVEHHVVSVGEVEDVFPLEEEGALLVVEGLVGGEVHD